MMQKWLACKRIFAKPSIAQPCRKHGGRSPKGLHQQDFLRLLYYITITNTITLYDRIGASIYLLPTWGLAPVRSILELVTETVYFSSFCGYDLLDSATKHLGRGKSVAGGFVVVLDLATKTLCSALSVATPE